jgi:hypothetical protein
MPGHFTHIYTARRVSDHLIDGEFPDWPQEASGIRKFDPVHCGTVMRTWEKYTAIGAIGPDLFYFSQDYNGEPLGPLSDDIMLMLAIYYYFDAAKEDDWEPLLIILDGVSSTIADLLRLLIKLQKIWQAFVQGWNDTIGPVVSLVDNAADALTGGLLSQFGVVVEELKVALKTIAEEELLTFTDIFSRFNTCVQKGFAEDLFLWSDMSHYRRPSALCQAFVDQVDKLAQKGMTQESEQFLAFTLGYITHLGTDTIAHAFVNEQCGGSFRNHPQRHHLIENHIDAWNYAQTAPGGKNAPDPWGYTADYPEVSMSALWYAVQITPDDPDGNIQGAQRPTGIPDDPIARKKALDVDGNMPEWMAEAIVSALIETFAKGPHPQIFQGSNFQSTIDAGLLTTLIEKVTGAGSDKPFPELLKGIAPKPSMTVPTGFPLPWQIQTIYKIMITFYKFSFTGSWEMSKPKKPDIIIFPPASDFQNLFQPPDLSGIDPSNPVDDVCGLFVALVDWAIKSLEAAGKLIEDLIKMLASPGTYFLRLGLYELAMIIWDIITKTHEILAHTGFFSPHSLRTYDDGELRLPDEIDIPMITLGGTVDGAFRAALAAAFDPLGNLDQNQDVIGDGHSVNDPRYPYYPVRTYDGPGLNGNMDSWEFHRPWAYPTTSVTGAKHNAIDTPTETYDPFSGFAKPPAPNDPLAPTTTVYSPLQPGPYRLGTMPDVFFDLSGTGDPQVRGQYEKAQTPWATDRLNSLHLGPRIIGASPLGNPVPFSAHLISQLVNPTGYSTQFNLDSDRAFAYLTWDWIRGGDTKEGILGLPYTPPVEPPPDADGWRRGTAPLKLKYVDPPNVSHRRVPRRPPRPPPIR